MESRITVARTRDYALIRQLATEPAIFRQIGDDYHTDPEKWQPIESDFVVYLVARDEQGTFGFGIFIPRTWSCYQAHFGFLPRSYGGQALAAWKAMFQWVLKNTKAARIVGEIRKENRLAIAFCKKAGCTEYGMNEKSILYRGQLRDQVCVGISRPNL